MKLPCFCGRLNWGDVMNANICTFVSTKKHDSSLNIINFVYEKEAEFKKDFIIPSTYTLALVTEGNGILHTTAGDFSIESGDLFFTLPAKAYYIENNGGLKYIYISFIGTRAAALIKRLNVVYTDPVFHGLGFLKENFENTFSLINDNNADLFCESLLLYTAGFISRSNSEGDHSGKANSLLLAKQYIDANFTDINLNLKSISEHFSYSPKYFSGAFKKIVKINFSEYLKIKRLSFAAKLIESGITNVNELAELCGYKDPLYFSKSFKEKYGVSPKRWSNGIN